MKTKYFLRGLGIGILLTTIVLVAIYSYRLSDKKTIERAKDLGMVMATEPATLETKVQEQTSQETSTIEQTSQETETTTVEQTSQETETTTVEQTSQETTTQQQITTQPSTTKASDASRTDGGNVQINIQKGLKAATLAQMLAETGMVDDAAGFTAYLIENNRTHTIRTGAFELTPGMTYEEIAEVLTYVP